MGIRVSKNSIERDFAIGRPCKRTKSDHDSSLDTNKNNTYLIPMDIVKDILQRLPAKSIAKFITVSKSWETIIRSNYFISSFSLQQSMTTQQGSHRLLFVKDEILEDNWGFFSSWSLNLATEKPPLEFISHMVPQFDRRLSFDLPIYVKGLLSFTYHKTQMICNPSNGKPIFLPVVKTRRKILSRYFGFDPIKAEYKVLCIIDAMYSRDGRITPSQNQVLTVGSKNIWRKLDFWIRHNPMHNKGICIDGIIYYLAYEDVGFPNTILVRFDVKSEKFLKQLPCLFLQHLHSGVSLTLINYKSKLAIEYQTNYDPIDLWVLEDSEKVEWLKISVDVSPWASLIIRYDIKIMGTTPNGEIVYACNGRKDGFYVIYHDHKKNQHRRIDIKPNLGSAYNSFMPRICFNDYVESVMLL